MIHSYCSWFDWMYSADCHQCFVRFFNDTFCRSGITTLRNTSVPILASLWYGLFFDFSFYSIKLKNSMVRNVVFGTTKAFTFVNHLINEASLVNQRIKVFLNNFRNSFSLKCTHLNLGFRRDFIPNLFL